MILISGPALSATFGAPIDRELTASSPTGSVSADFNEDGFPDMAFAMSGQAGGDGGLSVILSNGTGGFGQDQSVGIVTFAPTAVTAADFNGDSDMDLAAVGQGPLFEGRVQIFLGDGTGEFATPPQFDATMPGLPVAIAAGYIDGDANLDLLIVNGSGAGGVALRLGVGDGTFSAAQAIPASNNLNTQDIVTGDFNADGNEDFATNEGIYHGQGDGSFSRVMGIGGEVAVDSADLNNDGYADFMALGIDNDNELQSILNNGSGGYMFGSLQAIPTTHRDVVLADMNGDGFLDAVVTHETGNAVGIYPGAGDGSLGALESVAVGLMPYPLLAEDLNNDGLTDLAAAHANGSDTPFVSVLHQTLPGAGNASLQFVSTAYAAGEGAGVATITVQRSGNPAAAVSVDYAINDGTAIAGEDYVAGGGTLSFASGVLAVTFDVILIDDMQQEAIDETVALSLSNPTGGAVLGANTDATLIIKDNELPPMPGEFRFSSSAYSQVENAPKATITVQRVSGSDGAAQITFETSNGSATSGSDYWRRSVVLDFADGEVSRTVDVWLLDDMEFEGNETVNLTLMSPVTAGLGSPSAAILTILEDDPLQPGVLQFAVAASSADETAGTVTVEVTRTQGSDGHVTVNYQHTGISAVAGQDYEPVFGTVVFSDGVLSRNISITLIDDTEFETTETFEIRLFTPTGGATIGATDTLTFSIFSDDPLVATDDSVTMFKNTAVSIAVLANDNDPDGSASDISAVSAATNGVAVQVGDEISYTPNPDFMGQDSFTYTITDGVVSAMATVRVTVSADTPPVLLRRTTDRRWHSYTLGFDNVDVIIGDRGPIDLTRNDAYQTVSRSDFDGDGRPDLLVRDMTGAENGRWRMYTLIGTQITSSGTVDLTRNADWQLVSTDDFDGDGLADALLRNTVDGRWLLYLLNTLTVKVKGVIAMTTDLADTVVGTGDFNGDGRFDVLLRRLDGSWLMYLLDGMLTPVEAVPLMSTNLEFSVQALADFDGDNNTDALLRRTDGQWFMYMLDGATIVTSGPPAMTENTLVGLVSAADFNGDGNADALLRRTDGRWTLYSFNGLAILNQGTVGMTKNIAFQMISSDDFNEDNKADALLRRNDGRWVLYGLDGNGPTILGQGMPDMTQNPDWVPQVN